MENDSIAQKLILDLIRAAGRWNNFDGERIASDLEENTSLWRAAHFTVSANKLFPELREYSLDHKYNLRPLRDLSEGFLHNDILFLLPRADEHSRLEQLVARWNADDISWWTFDFVSRAMQVNRKFHSHLFPDESRALLYLWWD